jgi:hypothetical protein
MHIEKKSLVSKKAAAATIIAIHSRRVHRSKPAPARLLTCMTRATGGKGVIYMQ